MKTKNSVNQKMKDESDIETDIGKYCDWHV